MFSKRNKIVFLTFHNWDTKRQGGFHKFAEIACNKNYETIFFSFARPYYIFFKKDERLNKAVLLKLIKGVWYDVNGNKLLNITLPTFSFPGPLRKLINPKISIFFETLSLISFKKFSKKYFNQTNFFVFESNESIYLLDKVKRHFPKSKIIYRPSDPMIATNNVHLKAAEIKILKAADIVFIVNKEGVELYRSKVDNFDNEVNFKILSNGIDIEAYRLEYQIPEELKRKNTALYVGARDPDWQLIIDSAIRCAEINFVIVSPNIPSPNFYQQINKIENIVYVPGIRPENVPAWITNASVIIVPNPRDRFKDKPWGITAKYYQAMAAKKPIVSFHDTSELELFTIPVTLSNEEFVSEVKKALKIKEVDYSFDLKNKSWDNICTLFFDEIEKISNNEN
jgi:hypothetical protein